MKTQTMLGALLLGFLFGGVFPGPYPVALGQSNDLEIRIPGQQHDQVGYVHRDDGPEFHWFGVSPGRTTIVRNLPPGSFSLSLLCPSYHQDETLRAELGAGRATAIFRGTGRRGVYGVRKDVSVMELVPEKGFIALNRCGLEAVLAPILRATASSTATTDEISTAILRGSGRQISVMMGNIPAVLPETPIELWLVQLMSLAITLRTAHHAQQVDQLIEDQVRLWQSSKVGVKSERLLDGNLFLGALTASVEPPQVEPDDSAMITVRYLSSHEIPSPTKMSSYFLEVFCEPQISIDSRTSVVPTTYPPQEIVPTVETGQWIFKIKTAPNFKESFIVLKYRLLKKDNSGQLKEIRAGQFPEPIRLSAKPKPTCWERTRVFMTDFGAFIGLIVTTPLAVLQLLEYARKGLRKKRGR